MPNKINMLCCIWHIIWYTGNAESARMILQNPLPHFSRVITGHQGQRGIPSASLFNFVYRSFHDISRRHASNVGCLGNSHRSGGNFPIAVVVAHLAFDHAHGVRKAQPVGVEPARPCRMRHQLANSEMCPQQASQLLQHQIGRLAAKHRAISPQVRLNSSNTPSISRRSYYCISE